MVVVSLVVLPLIIYGRRFYVTSRLAQDGLADVAVEVEETVNVTHTIQAFGWERHMRENIVSSGLDASHDMITDAARKAQSDAFILSLDGGMMS